MNRIIHNKNMPKKDWLSQHTNKRMGRKRIGPGVHRITQECPSGKEKYSPSTTGTSRNNKRYIPIIIDSCYEEEDYDFYEYFEDDEYSSDHYVSSSRGQSEIGGIMKEKGGRRGGLIRSQAVTNLLRISNSYSSADEKLCT